MAMIWFCQRCLKDFNGEPLLNKATGMSLCTTCSDGNDYDSIRE